MSDLISRQAAIKEIEELIKVISDEWLIDARGEIHGLDAALCSIIDLPSVKSVPVIRCKDCKHFEDDKRCMNWGSLATSDGYCSYAERRTDETD